VRRGLLTIIAASVLVAVVPGATVLADFGYADHGTDPDDVSPTGQRVDIRATTRKVSQDGAGKRWLSITIRSYDHSMMGTIVSGRSRRRSIHSAVRSVIRASGSRSSRVTAGATGRTGIADGSFR
jgi:hypothetical protein